MNRALAWPSSERSRARRARGEAGLYVIVDADACERRGLEVGEVLRCVLESSERPEVVQLRAKGRSDASVEALLEAALPLAEVQEVEFVVNDRPDLAALLGAGSVHVGQDDSPLEVVRAGFPELAVGLSTHDLAQLDAALGVPGLAYVAFGPVFSTGSKERAEPVVGLELLAAAGRSSRERGVPLVGIGGIDVKRIAEVAPHVDLVAVIAAALPDVVDVSGARSERAPSYQTPSDQVPSGGATDELARAITQRLGTLQVALRQNPGRG